MPSRPPRRTFPTDSTRRSPGSNPRSTRRGVLAAAAALPITGTAGCTTVADWIADHALGEVNLFNETDDRVHGRIEILAPDDEVVLEERFELGPQTDDDGDGEDDAVESYDDVWQASGEYDVAVELDEGFEVGGESSAEATVEIDDPDEEMLGVPFGVPEFDGGIGFAVAESWSEFA